MSTHTILPAHLLNTRSVQFNGVDEYARKDAPSFASDTAGSLFGWVRFDSLPAVNGIVVFAHFGGASAGVNARLGFLVRYAPTVIGVGKWRYEILTRKSSTPSQINHSYGNTDLSTGTWYFLTAESDGSTWTKYLNNALESDLSFIGGSANTGDWFGDINPAGTDVFSFGASMNDGTISNHIHCTMNQWGYVAGRVLTAGERTALWGGGHPVNPRKVLGNDLTAYWPMAAPDDVTGTLAEQVGSNGLTTVAMDAGTNYIAATP